jgi:SAM-dependent methyltransferase
MNNNLLHLIQTAYRGIMPEPARLFLYQHMPGALQDQFDSWGTQVRYLPLKRPLMPADLKLPSGPFEPGRFPRRANKICDEADWQGEEWLSLFDSLGEPQRATEKHRKAWEWAQGIYALQHLGLLHDDTTAIGIGAGIESILFYLANQIKMVYATDIYGEGDFAGDTAQAGMLTDPARYATIPYRKDHLTVMHMNGLHLEFPDNFFDFAFSFSSIEHFGGHAAAAQSVREMARVIRPGGSVILTSEVILNGHPHEEFFLPQEIQEYLINGTGLEPIEEIDYTISAQTLENALDQAVPGYETQLPHIVLKHHSIYFTSFCLVLQKPKS